MNEGYLNFDEYIRQGEPTQKERAEAWSVAIGLQAVDGLKTSEYLQKTARRNIEGEITIDEARELVKQYYVKKNAHDAGDEDKEEADRVSSNISKLLQSDAFTYSVAGLAAIHRAIFDGVFKHAGLFRDYDITKKEWVLHGDSVLYGRWQDLRMTIEYDLEQEHQFVYVGLDNDQMVEHIARFVSGLWQIHPFREGNTRTMALFTIKYLRMLGFSVSNDLFANHSWYFRNALVRANYRNVAKGIEHEPIFLVRFFRNLLLGENYILKNRYMLIDAPEEWNLPESEQVKNI
ncbi:MAG: Fic family protein, partial [Prevotella sp.]|nr:Fic family protein [Prevotella sp.]